MRARVGKRSVLGWNKSHADQSILTNIPSGTGTMEVHCNAGNVHIDHVGDLHGFTHDINWYHPGGI